MKSDPRTDLLKTAAVAGVHAPGSGRWATSAVQLVLLIGVPLTILGLASLAAGNLVRVGADLRLGLDPFATPGSRIRIGMREVALRAIALDVVRQILIMLLVLALARWHDGVAWRRRLALTRPAEQRAPIRRVWLLGLLLIWPVIHIAWVSAAAQALNLDFGRGARISPILTPVLVAWWLSFAVLLAPIAEELLIRGEAFARASAFMSPAGAIVATALLFCLLHVLVRGPMQAILLIPLAITLSWLRWRTGRLWPCILLHSWSNLAFVAYLLRPGAS